MQGIGKMASGDGNRNWRRELHLAKLEMGLTLPFSGMKVRFETAGATVSKDSGRKTAA